MFTNSLSTQKRLFIMFLLVALIPLLTLGVIAYKQSANVVNGKLSDYNEFAGEKIETQLDQTLEDMYYGAAAIKQYVSDSTSIDLKHQIPKTYSDFKAANNLERMLEAHKKSNIRGIYIITPSGYFYGHNDLEIDKFKREELWKRAIKSGNSEIGISDSPHYEMDNPKHILSLIVPLKSSFGVLNNSYLLIETNVDDLFELMKVLENRFHSTIFIRNEAGGFIYSTNNNRENDKDDIVYTEQTQTNNWTIEIRIPREEFYRSSNIIFKIVSIGICISLVLALLLSYIFSNHFTRRILKLKFAIDEVSKGIFDTKLHFHMKDEIGKLGLHFNRMVDKIKQLMEEVREKETAKREAEMRAIHYQINPHLLFNTLNTIQWKARLDGNVEIGSMLRHLSKVLEGNLNFNIELISLEEELESIQHFLAIQELRYGPNFTFTLRMDEKLKYGLIPRMTFQPMLENIFFHAFEDGKGEIELEINILNDYFHFILKDNGKGISQENLQTLFSRSSKVGRGGIGLSNIKQKFTVHYGKEYIIQTDSVANEGTMISITWPKRWVETDANGTD